MAPTTQPETTQGTIYDAAEPQPNTSRELTATELADKLEQAIRDVIYGARLAIGERRFHDSRPGEHDLWLAVDRLEVIQAYPSLIVARIKRPLG